MPAASSNCDTIVTYVLLEESLLGLVLIGRMLIWWPLISVTIVTTMLRERAERLSSTWAPPKVPNVRRLFASDASSTHLATHRALPANPLLQTEGVGVVSSNRIRPGPCTADAAVLSTPLSRVVLPMISGLTHTP